MDILEKMRWSDFSRSEARFRDFILKEPKRILELSAEEVADLLGLSTSSLYRFCEKLGLCGYNSLLKEIARSLAGGPGPQDVDLNFPFSRDEDTVQVMGKIEADYLKTIRLQSRLMDPTALERAVCLMKRSESVDVYTSAGNLHMAENFCFQMKEIGARVRFEKDEYNLLLQAGSSGPRRAALLITLGGRGILTEKIINILNETHTPVILIASPGFRPKIERLASRIYFSSSEHHSEKISSFSTRFALMYILDTLYALYFKEEYDENLKRRLEIYRTIRKGI